MIMMSNHSTEHMVEMRVDKKKLVKILRIIAYISIAIWCILFFYTRDGENPSSIFLFYSLSPILGLLSIPSFDRPFLSVKTFRNSEIKSNVLLWIYTIAAIGIIIIITIIPFSYSDYISDLPNLISKNYSQISHEDIRTVKEYLSSKGPNGLRILADDGTQLRVVEDAFKPIHVGEKYTFLYLPRTKWVMDILDENNVSLLRSQ